MSTETLNGRRAVVTGASRGIGLHIARALAEAGAEVGLTGRNLARVEAASAAVGDRAHAFEADQRDPSSIAALADQVESQIGAIDLLVCNAGVIKGAPVKELGLDGWNEVIETNLTGTFLTVQAFLPALSQNDRGDIFIISSMSGKKGDPGAAAYAASKFGLQGFAQSLMHELRRDDIRVMVLNPSSVDTGEDKGSKFGPGLHLHAADLGATVAHLAALPGRTMIRDMDIYGTNPF